MINQQQHVGFVHQLDILDANGQIIDRQPPICNRVPQDGIAFLIQSPFGDTAPIPNFYCGLFVNNYVPTDNTTAADIPSVMGEFTQYSETTRPVWERTFTPFNQYDNNLDSALFTPTQDSLVYGSFLVSSATKGSNSGLIISAARYTTAKQLTTGNEVRLRISLVYLPTNTL